MIEPLRRTFAATLVFLFLTSVLITPLSAQTSEAVYDIVIRNRRVLDGAGNPWIVADVAIKDGRFVRIGKIDVTIFDYDKIQDRATYEQPLLSPVGIDFVLVNGQVVIENGKHTGARPGGVIYGPGRRIQ
ncbi:MAG: hypothetical protein H0X72_13765 [Acidobacteria bacterium]|jgi:N-acyl-D-amino-acid deacylase|nr:hypothetical protein [Acidobacteriota bacterium]